MGYAAVLDGTGSVCSHFWFTETYCMGLGVSNDGGEMAALILQDWILFRVQGVGCSDHTDVSNLEDVQVGGW